MSGAGVAGIHRDMVALIHAVHDVRDVALDALRRDAVFGVVGHLLFAPAVRFLDGALHGAGDLVGIENDPAIDISCGAADGLHQRGFGAQEAFLVGIENGDQGAFRNIQAFAQQVDADQHVEGAEAEIADDLDALQRINVAVHVAHAHALLVHVFGEVLGHALGEHGDEAAVALERHFLHLGDEIIDLGFHRADDDRADR